MKKQDLSSLCHTVKSFFSRSETEGNKPPIPIPVEVLQIIYRFLPNARDKLNFALTAKIFLKAATKQDQKDYRKKFNDLFQKNKFLLLHNEQPTVPLLRMVGPTYSILNTIINNLETSLYEIGIIETVLGARMLPPQTQGTILVELKRRLRLYDAATANMIWRR